MRYVCDIMKFKAFDYTKEQIQNIFNNWTQEDIDTNNVKRESIPVCFTSLLFQTDKMAENYLKRTANNESILLEASM